MDEGWELILLYLAFIPLAILLLYLVSLGLGSGILMPVLGASLTIASFVIYRFLPKKDATKLFLAVASASVWLFELLRSALSSDFNPLYLGLFILSTIVLLLVYGER